MMIRMRQVTKNQNIPTEFNLKLNQKSMMDSLSPLCRDKSKGATCLV